MTERFSIMYGEWATRRIPLKIKVETAAQLAKEWDWPKDTLIHNMPCGCVHMGNKGRFKVTWCGDYIGTDRTVQRRISYRCDICHKIVTFMDRTDDNGKTIGELERQVIYP
jgi:c-di-AMP phosphodiesterase-like protein